MHNDSRFTLCLLCVAESIDVAGLCSGRGALAGGGRRSGLARRSLYLLQVDRDRLLFLLLLVGGAVEGTRCEWRVDMRIVSYGVR